MTMNSEELLKLIVSANNYFRQQQYFEARDVLFRCITHETQDIDVLFNLSGLLIDIGSALEDVDCINRGIAIIENLLEKVTNLPRTKKHSLEYNLSNGYSWLFNYFFEQKQDEEALINIQKAKSILQNLILNKEELDPEIYPAILTNYANTLDHLNRFVEAIDFYYDCLSVYPNHPISLANCASTIRRYFGVDYEHLAKNVFEAYRLFSLALNDDNEITKWVAPHIATLYKKQFEKFVHEIETNYQTINALLSWQKHREEKHSQPVAPEWLQQIKKDRLLLTFNVMPLVSLEECVDDTFFKGIETVSGELGIVKFTRLVNILNSIKEDFSTARFLFYLKDTNENISSWSLVTHYASTPDNANYSMELGLLKASFRLTVDIFDKVANFLNYYYELNASSGNLNINNIWFASLDAKKGIYHSVIEASLRSNPYLAAIRDLQRDWFHQLYPGPLKKARDEATHHFLPLYLFQKDYLTNKYFEGWEVDTLKKRTHFILRQMKAVIIYLICTVIFDEYYKDGKKIQIPFLYGESDYDVNNK